MHGQIGVTGVQGQQGVVGPPGVAGPIGPPGPQGVQGPPGSDCCCSGGGTTYTAGEGISLANDVITNTKPMAIVSLDGVSYPDVAVLELNGFTTSTSNVDTTLSITAPAGSGGAVYTSGTSISINSSNVISCTPPVYTGGANINIDGSNVVSCTLAPLNVSIDGGASTTPSTLSFVGFSAVDNSGVITISGSNFTYYGGTNISIDGSNNINCDLSPLAVVLDGGASTTPSTLSFV